MCTLSWLSHLVVQEYNVSLALLPLLIKLITVGVLHLENMAFKPALQIHLEMFVIFVNTWRLWSLQACGGRCCQVPRHRQ